MTIVVGLLGGLAAVGVLLLTTAWQAGRAPSIDNETDWRAVGTTVFAAVIAALVVFVLTGWAVVAFAAALGAAAAVRSLSADRRSPADEQLRIEGLASWCEQLRDLLAAEQGITSTITATAASCPRVIRGHVVTLSNRLARQDPATAIAQFADEFDDPSADLVATVLVEATRRSSRTSELLGELATTIRERAAMRLRVESERSGQRSEARFVIGFTLVAVTGIAVFGRDTEFLDAYDDGTGQLVLGLVVVLFVGGVRWLRRLTVFERPARFLTATTPANGGGEDGR